jgi:hypothetical protein
MWRVSAMSAMKAQTRLPAESVREFGVTTSGFIQVLYGPADVDRRNNGLPLFIDDTSDPMCSSSSDRAMVAIVSSGCRNFAGAW